jgi:hypothetical protein
MKAPISRSVENKSQPSSSVVPRKSQGRSRITNGSALLPSVDGRSVWARRFRDLIQLHVDDKGGDQNVSEAERALIRRAACLIVELERLEVRFAESGGADKWELDRYGRHANTLRRLLTGLGLERRPRIVSPDITPQIIDQLRSIG